MDDSKALVLPDDEAAGRGTRLRGCRPLRPEADPPHGASQERRTGTVWFDYTDLIHYFADNRVPTGIQRVQIGLFRACLDLGSLASAERVAACSFDVQRRCWVALDQSVLASVCHAATASPGDNDESWHGMTAALRQSVATGRVAGFMPGDMLVNIGSSWWIPDYLCYVRHMQRERGIVYAAFVHDCIPLRVPETCSANLVDEFKQWFGETMRCADLVLANSEHTARDIALLGPSFCSEPVKAHVVRLDAGLDDGPQPGAVIAAKLDAATHAALGVRRPFALFVATLEARKNHLFVFQCWRELIERHGDSVPDLLCVGKQGWLFEYTLNWLRVHPQLAERVRMVGTLSDREIAALYRTAQFTVYCSHYEGWGLPITESLCHGRVPLVPDHTSLPEAGGAFAAYYEAGSQEAFCAQAERLMDKTWRAELESRIRARYRPRGWRDVLTQLITAVREGPLRGAAARVPAVRTGRIYALGHPRPANPVDAESGDGLRHGIGWHTAEDWGVWSRLPQAHLLFSLQGRPRETVLYLILRGGRAEQVVRVQVGGRELPPVALNPGQRRLITMPLDRTAVGRELMVTLMAPPYSLAPHTDGGDPREIGFGMEAMAVADRRDPQARLTVLEHFLTQS